MLTSGPGRRNGLVDLTALAPVAPERPPLTLHQAKAAQLLAALAWMDCEQSLSLPASMVRACVGVCSPLTGVANRMAAWEEYRARVAVEFGIEFGSECPDPLAVSSARRRSEEALDVLLGRSA